MTLKEVYIQGKHAVYKRQGLKPLPLMLSACLKKYFKLNRQGLILHGGTKPATGRRGGTEYTALITRSGAGRRPLTVHFGKMDIFRDGQLHVGTKAYHGPREETELRWWKRHWACNGGEILPPCVIDLCAGTGAVATGDCLRGCLTQ